MILAGSYCAIWKKKEVILGYKILVEIYFGIQEISRKLFWDIGFKHDFLYISIGWAQREVLKTRA